MFHDGKLGFCDRKIAKIRTKPENILIFYEKCDTMGVEVCYRPSYITRPISFYAELISIES